jgi:hypothetical protein
VGSYAAARGAVRKRVVTSSVRRCALGAITAALSVCAFAGAAGVAATNGLVAAYSFDAGAGTTLADSSGNNNNGSIVGATWSTTGKFGKALSFNGQSSYVSIPDAASLHLSALTLEAWVRPTALSAVWRTAIFKERPGGMAYALYANTDANRPAGQVYTTAEQNASGVAQLPLNTWTHLATTFASGTLKLYVNGAEVSSVAVSGSAIASTGLLKIGGNAVWGEWFSGLIDEVRIYNRALAVSEVQTDMNSSVSAPDSTPPTAPTALAVTGRTRSPSRGRRLPTTSASPATASTRAGLSWRPRPRRAAPFRASVAGPRTAWRSMQSTKRETGRPKPRSAPRPRRVTRHRQPCS